MNGNKAGDPWFAGFEEGRRATARAVAAKLRGTMDDEEIAGIVGFDAAELFAEPTPEGGEGAEAAAPRSRYDHAAVPGLRLLEPSFVRAVRAARRLTQPQLAAMLGVNARTVCEWENSPVPVRVKSASYDRLGGLAAGRRGENAK